MKKTYQSILILVTLTIFLVFTLIKSSFIIQNFLDYSILFLQKLFPVSFLFFLFSSLLVDYGFIQILEKIFHKNSSSFYLFVVSMISGFPSGAKYTKELLDKSFISLEEANQALLFSHFPNPLFVLGSVNMVLGDLSLSFKILISIVFSNFFLFLFREKGFSSNICMTFQNPKDFSSVLSKAISHSFQTLLIIYGTSLFFYLMASIITNFVPLSIYPFIFMNGLFDLTKGVFSTTLISNIFYRSLFILFFISFGGISIHMQVKSILSDTPISYSYYLRGRIIGTILSFLIFGCLILFFS